MNTFSFVNRHGLRIVVLVEENPHARGLAIVMHGLSANKEELQVLNTSQAFKEEGFTVVRFDTTNTFGESDGQYEDATVTSYYSDLEDVIAWCKKQPWYREPFYLAGHSLGAISTALYAENHPQEVKALAPLSALVSGELSKETQHERPEVKDWEKTGWRVEKSNTSPTGFKRLPWSHMIDRLKYDLLPKADNLTMPVLLVVGDNDTITPYQHQKMLYDKLPGDKELHIIKEAPHTFRRPEHLDEVKEILKTWIQKTNKM